MDNRKYVLIFLFLMAAGAIKAQVAPTLQQVDSATYALYQAADWKQLIIVSNKALDAGIDFPVLRERLGYALLIGGNYSGALNEYVAVFKNDSHNQTARYYAYLCHKYLNQESGASYNAGYLDTGTLKSENTSAFGLIDAGFETGLKFVSDTYRGNATYTRASLSNRLGWRLQLDQSVVYFNQAINNNTVQIPGAPLVTANADEQLEYYAKLSYSLTENLLVMGSYHYLNTNYQNADYNSNIGLAGLKYTGTCFNIQGDINWGYMIDHHLVQYNAAVMVYPLGNLNLYAISRGSSMNQNGGSQFIFNQVAGFKMVKNTWAETSATFGNLDNYIDADGLYIYNAIDATKLKVGETIFYQAGKHALLQLNYTYEKKQDNTHSINYNQNSITAGILWKF